MSTGGLTSDHFQATLIAPSGYATNNKNNVVLCDAHPAYTNPNLPTTMGRMIMASGASPIKLDGDLKKAVAKIYDLASVASPPLHFPLGKDAVKNFRAHFAEVSAEVDKYESWSEGLAPDE